MKIAVIGGTGMVGSEVVSSLAGDGHEVRILSRRPPESPTAGTSHHRIDLHTREGLDDALHGVDTVVDAGNEMRAAKKILVDGTRDLLQRCEEASVGHYVGISIVGCEQLKFNYYVAKTAQEEVIRESRVPWSLLRSTQFHELLASVFKSAARFKVSPTGHIPLQTVSASVVADRLAGMAVSPAIHSTETIAGPQVEDLGSMSRTWRSISGRRCLPLPVWLPGKTGLALRDGALTDPSAATPGPKFAEWLATRGG